MDNLAASILEKAGPEWLLIFVLVLGLGWMIRYILRLHATDMRQAIKLREKMATAFHTMAEAFRELREDLRRK